MYKILMAVGGVASVVVAPVLASAATGEANLTFFSTLATQVGGIVGILITIAAAILFFFWGLAKFILSAGDEEAKDAGKRIMIWGILAIAVMASIWGIVAWLQSATGVDGTVGPATIKVPKVQN
jgi:hypothetical protein